MAVSMLAIGAAGIPYIEWRSSGGRIMNSFACVFLAWLFFFAGAWYIHLLSQSIRFTPNQVVYPMVTAIGTSWIPMLLFLLFVAVFGVPRRDTI
jgi:cation transporter-like permease